MVENMGDGEDGTHFSILCSGDSDLTTLVPGKTLFEEINTKKEKSRFYEIFVPEEHSTL
jgi:hypothetical protein